MKWASALSTRPSLEAAVDEVVQLAQASLGTTPDLGLIFISSTFASEYPRLLPLLRERLPVPHLVGCGGEGVIGCDRTGATSELEGSPALVLMLAHLPGVKIQTFHLDAEAFPDLDSSPDAWIELLGVSALDQPHFILLADAMSAKINDLLQGLDYAYPGAIKIGGLTNATPVRPGGCLLCDRQLYREGTVGVALSGNVLVETIVAQGCRPIGPPYRVAAAEKNILLKLEEQKPVAAGAALGRVSEIQTPLEALQSLLQEMSEADRLLAQHSLFIGVVRDEFKQDLGHGDFLIRNLIGVDPRVGAIAIGDRIRPGQRIQFHLRDAQASAEDLEMLLQRHQQTRPPAIAEPTGALLFACLGRGEGLYHQPNFDSQLFRRYFSDTPLAGFFCQGEIGPLGDTTFLHGYTSAFAIFRQPPPA